MLMVAIGAAERVDELRERLAAELRPLQADGYEIQMKTFERGDLTFVACDLGGKRPVSPEVTRRLRAYVASAVSEEIVNRWEDHHIRRLIRAHYGYFDLAEQEKIYRYACRSLYPDEEHNPSSPARLRRRSMVLARLSEYLERYTELVVDGFITFRLKDYVEELEDAVDLAVDEFLMDKEYTEFIHLLRYFVEIQEPRVDRVDVYLDPDGSFRLMDTEGRPVGRERAAFAAGELAEGLVDQEDLLIGTLIALMPSSIILHSSRQVPRQATEAVQKVFGSRVRFCPGCTGCRAALASRRQVPPGGEV